MNFQDTISKLESVKQKAPKIERNMAPFYQHWQRGVSMAMKGNLDANPIEHTSAYIEGLLDAIYFLEMEYFDRIYNKLS
ncbi:MAG: hypothetical protein ACFCAD_15095 [Pleurocapsa sp.]